MAIPTTPAGLIAAAGCYACIPPAMQPAVLTYLLAELAGLSGTDAETLVASAACYSCIPNDLHDSLQSYLTPINEGGLPTNDPEDIAAICACYTCIPKSLLRVVQIYVLAYTAGLDSMSAAELVDAAKCYACVPDYVRTWLRNAWVSRVEDD